MPRRGDTNLRLRSTDGLREDLKLSIPDAWLQTLRARAAKLDISLETLCVQALGHTASESEKMSEPSQVGDDPARLILRDGLRESYRREAHRSGLSIRVLLNRVVQRAADAFDGEQYESRPAPIELASRRKAAGQ